ncbi:hypothetical protein [Cetobacterium sp.]|uniref:hypothetical protein n=1 Tax=Cetobacterium sp. TaxID=2071632 RepID=UPI003F3EFDCC
MYLDINEIRKNDVTKELLLDIIEAIYNNLNNNKYQNIIINEYVTDILQDTSILNQYSFTLSKVPISINDISIVSEDGELILTPKHIVEIDKTRVTIKNNKIKSGMNFFVTFKH